MCVCDTDTTVNSAATNVNTQQPRDVSQSVSVDVADNGSRNTVHNTSQSLPGFKRCRQMRRQLTSPETAGSATMDSGRRRCDDALSQSDSVRCASDLNTSHQQRVDDRTQLIANHFCVNCQQLMVCFSLNSFFWFGFSQHR